MGGRAEKCNEALLLAIGIEGSLSFVNQVETVILFKDSFSRGNSNNLNANGSGKSGVLTSTVWIERPIGGTWDAEVLNSELVRLNDSNTGGNSGMVIYLDNNFSNLTSFVVSMRLLDGSTGSNGRDFGFSIGNSKAELDSQSSASASGAKGDFSLFY